MFVPGAEGRLIYLPGFWPPPDMNTASHWLASQTHLLTCEHLNKTPPSTVQTQWEKHQSEESEPRKQPLMCVGLISNFVLDFLKRRRAMDEASARYGKCINTTHSTLWRCGPLQIKARARELVKAWRLLLELIFVDLVSGHYGCIGTCPYFQPSTAGLPRSPRSAVRPFQALVRLFITSSPINF